MLRVGLRQSVPRAIFSHVDVSRLDSSSIQNELARIGDSSDQLTCSVDHQANLIDNFSIRLAADVVAVLLQSVLDDELWMYCLRR